MLINAWTKFAGTVAVIVAFVAAGTGTGLSIPQPWDGIPVAALDAPQLVLVGKWVEDRSGRLIGRVRSVDVGREGKAEVVNIEIGAVRPRGTQIVAVNAHQIVYYPQKGKLVASIDPPPVRVPNLPANAPERASAMRPPPQPTIYQD